MCKDVGEEREYIIKKTLISLFFSTQDKIIPPRKQNTKERHIVNKKNCESER